MKYANLYGNLRYRPRFADFRVNLRDGTTGVFHCQRRESNCGLSDPICRQIDLSISQAPIRSQLWRVKVQRAMFLPPFAVSSSPVWGNYSKADC
jgi:hypothetical protein